MKLTFTYKRISVLLLPLALYGCAKPHDMSGGSESSTTEVAYSQSNLESGNVPESDSSTPTTGDAEEDAEANANAEAGNPNDDDDAHAGNEEIIPKPNCGSAKHVLVQILWGNLPGGAAPTVSTDWTGTFTGSNGAVVKPVRAIRFESNDTMTGEFTEGFGWKSSTKPAMDGVLAVVGLPPPPTVEMSPVPVATVTFNTKPLKVSFRADELGRLNQVFKVDDQGNAVSFRSIPQGRCAHGFMRGHWKRVDAKGGTFRGQWMGPMGARVRGFIEGIWGVRTSGERVFVGRFVSRSGKIRGKVAGHYENGYYRGIWTRHGKVRGVLRGHYAEGTTQSAIDASVTVATGFFGGEWMKFCSKYRRCEATVSSGASGDAANANDMAIEESATETTSMACE
jgi:hypothetical protein